MQNWIQNLSSVKNHGVQKLSSHGVVFIQIYLQMYFSRWLKLGNSQKQADSFPQCSKPSQSYKISLLSLLVFICAMHAKISPVMVSFLEVCSPLFPW